MHASVRSPRAALLAVACLSALTVTACVRGRNDGGKDPAGNSSNGAGPAPQPGPLGGENTDTTTAPPNTPPAAATGPAPAASAVQPGAAGQTATPPAGGTKRP